MNTHRKAATAPALTFPPRRGVSLIEIILYIVVTLAVIVGGIVFFEYSRMANKVVDTGRFAMSASGQLRSLYGSSTEFGTQPLTPALISSGALPGNAFNGGGEVRVPVGGRFYAHGKEEAFAFVFTELREDACLRLAPTSPEGTGTLGTGILGVQLVDIGNTANPLVVGNAVASFNPATYTLPFTPQMAAAQCRDDVEMIVVYSK